MCLCNLELRLAPSVTINIGITEKLLSDWRKCQSDQKTECEGCDMEIGVSCLCEWEVVTKKMEEVEQWKQKQQSV